MVLQAIHASLDDIPEQYQDLYTEKNGQFELTGIQGVKTQADIDRLQTALTKERDEHKATKAAGAVWAELDHEDVMSKLDRIPELEAAAADKFDEAAIEDAVNRRVEGTINSKLAPLERQVKQLTDERDQYKQGFEKLTAKDRTRQIHDNVREQLTKNKVIPEAFEDALMVADRVFEIREDDNAIVTKDGVGVTPGVTADIWLTEIQTTRPHWFPGSVGGGAGGSGGGRGGVNMANNPWSHEGWNMTKQGEILRTQGREQADNLAKAAGTTVGGPKPKPRASN